MASASVAQAVNRQPVAAALQAARTEAAEHRAWINAITRAVLNREACPLAFDGEVLRIASASSSTRSIISVDGCACQTGQAGTPCWHRAAWRLLRKAAVIIPPARPVLTEAERAAIVDELYEESLERGNIHTQVLSLSIVPRSCPWCMLRALIHCRGIQDE